MSCTRYACMASLRRALIENREPEWLKRHPRRGYIVQAVLASPPWVDRKAMRELAKRARRLSAQTGVRYVLDHIESLTSPSVCGLNVPWNLRIVPYAVNAAKGNSRPHLNRELFEQPEQLRMFA